MLTFRIECLLNYTYVSKVYIVILFKHTLLQKIYSNIHDD